MDFGDLATPATGLSMAAILVFVLKYMVAAMDKQREGYILFTQEMRAFIVMELNKHNDSIHDLAKIQCMLLMKMTEPGSAAHATATKELTRLEKKDS